MECKFCIFTCLLLITLIGGFMSVNISIVTTLPNSPHLYDNDEVRVQCNGGLIGNRASEFGLIFQGLNQNYICTATSSGLSLNYNYSPLIDIISPASDRDCREIQNKQRLFEFIFKPHRAGLTYHCLMYADQTTRTSEDEELPETIHKLPNDTQLLADGDDYYEGSTVNTTCTVTGGVPTTTTYQYSLNGQTFNSTGTWRFEANRTMMGNITCTSTEHLPYRDRSQPGLMASRTINIYYIDLTPAAQGVVEKELNPGSNNSIDCQDFRDTNLPSSDLTYSWSSAGKTVSNQPALNLHKREASGTIQFTCEITGRKLRDAGPYQVRRVVVNVTWNSMAASPPTIVLQKVSLSPGAIGGIVGGLLLVLVVVIALIISARHRLLCFKRSRSDNRSVAL